MIEDAEERALQVVLAAPLSPFALAMQCPVPTFASAMECPYLATHLLCDVRYSHTQLLCDTRYSHSALVLPPSTDLVYGVVIGGGAQDRSRYALSASPLPAFTNHPSSLFSLPSLHPHFNHNLRLKQHCCYGATLGRSMSGADLAYGAPRRGPRTRTSSGCRCAPITLRCP
eukprot:3941156-Rhodomonas_salina.8